MTWKIKGSNHVHFGSVDVVFVGANISTEENQGALGMGARGQGRLTESSGSLNDV